MVTEQVEPLTIRQVLRVRRTLGRWIEPTPTRAYPGLNQHVGLDLLLKHENWCLTGAFKIRGSLNLLLSLQQQGVNAACTASTGNLGLGVACAANMVGMRAFVCVPEGANTQKVEAIESYGAEIITQGEDFDEAREWIQGQASRLKAAFVSTTAPEMITGAGTYTHELLLDHPDVDAVVVPVGGGSGACGAAIVAKAIDPRIQVIGVQSQQAPALQRAWASGNALPDACTTYAEGIATRVPFANTMAIMRRLLDDFVLVHDDAILRAQALLWHLTRQHVEAASAATLAAVIQANERFAGKRIALIMTGGNVSALETRRVAEFEAEVQEC